MRFSLFRLTDIIENFIIYLICFTSISIFKFLSFLNFGNSPILRSFFKNIIDYELIICTFLSFIIVIFHYQFIKKKKTEVYCRILVGDNNKKITIRYIFHAFSILVSSFLLSIILNYYLRIDIYVNIYLLLIFTIYILISASQVFKK